MTAVEARQVLRTLLRAVDRNITAATGNRQWRDFVVAEFRRGAELKSLEERGAALQQAKDYAFLVTSVHQHKVNVCAAPGWTSRVCLISAGPRRRVGRLPPAACLQPA